MRFSIEFSLRGGGGLTMIMKLVEFSKHGIKELDPDQLGLVDRFSYKHEDTRDEPARLHLNLAEFPWAVLSTRADRTKTLCVRGQRADPSTKKSQIYEWIVQPHPDYGLPGPLGQKVFFEALQIWYSQGKHPAGLAVYGRKRTLLKRLGSKRHPSSRDYHSLLTALKSLSRTTIIARNCFYDRRAACYVPEVEFSPIDSFVHDPADKYQNCYIRLPRELTTNVGTNDLINLRFTRDQYHGMPPLQRRFLPYLAKFMALQEWHTKTLDELRDLGPIETKSDRKLRQTLKAAFDPLLSVIPEFRNWKFDTRKNGEPCVVFYSTRKRTQSTKPRRILLSDPQPGSQAHYELEKVERTTGSTHRFLWLVALEELGPNRFSRCRGELVDAELDRVKNPGKVFWANMKKLANKEWGIDLDQSMKTKYLYKPKKRGNPSS